MRKEIWLANRMKKNRKGGFCWCWMKNVTKWRKMWIWKWMEMKWIRITEAQSGIENIWAYWRIATTSIYYCFLFVSLYLDSKRNIPIKKCEKCIVIYALWRVNKIWPIMEKVLLLMHKKEDTMECKNYKGIILNKKYCM